MCPRLVRIAAVLTEGMLVGHKDHIARDRLVGGPCHRRHGDRRWRRSGRHDLHTIDDEVAPRGGEVTTAHATLPALDQVVFPVLGGEAHRSCDRLGTLSLGCARLLGGCSSTHTGRTCRREEDIAEGTGIVERCHRRLAREPDPREWLLITPVLEGIGGWKLERSKA